MARASSARWPHLAPLLGLLSLDLVMLRHVFLSHGFPVGGDSGFLYSALPYFARHGLGTFSVWLPSPLGEVQQYSLYWALGSVVSVVGAPVEVYKLAMLAVIALTSVIMYGFAYWLTRDRFAAAIASFAYSFAPFAVAQWLDGHMNVQVSYAVGPATIWTLWLALRSGGRRPMVVLGLSEAALFLLTTGQGAYWVLGLVVVVCWEIATSSSRWRVARRLGVTAIVSSATFIAASAVQLVPYALGAKAPFVGGGAAYYIEQLSVHRKYSLGFLDGVVGTPRELYLLPGTTIGAPGFADWQFQVLGLVLVGIAFASLATRAWRHTVPLGVIVLMAWLLAAGPAGPAGSIYVGLYDHVPVIRFLRVPNRWLMVSSMGIALMLAVTLAAARQLSRSASTKFVRRLFRRTALLAVAIVAVSGTYAFAPGLKTWNPQPLYGSAFTPLREDKGNWRILTTPLFQSWMDGQGPSGNGESFVADLGYTSSYWHEHAVLGRGGWDPRAARFSKYLYELVRQGTTTSIAPLLAAIDVKYVSLDPQPAIESVLHQNAFFRRQADLTPLRTSGPITLLRTENTAPSAFVSAKRCVVAGGMSTLGDLAATRLIDLQTTPVVFADQLVATGGRSELARQLKESRCLILAPGGTAALRILMTAVAAQSIPSVSPAGWLRSETSPIEDVSAEPTTEVSVPGRSIISFSFSVPRTARYRVWLNALRDPAQRGIAVRVDSDALSRISLRSTFGSGYRWNPTGPLVLTAGTHHVTLSAIGPRSLIAHLTNLAVTPVTGRPLELITALGKHVIRETGGTGPVTARTHVIATPKALTRGPWHLLPASGHVTSHQVLGAAGIQIHIRRGGRKYFTLATVSAAPVEPTRAFAIRFRGSGDGRTYYLNAMFGGDADASLGYRFRDTRKGLRTIVLSPLQPSFSNVSPDWLHVRSFTLSSSTRKRPHGPLTIEGPFETRISLTPHFSAGLRANASSADKRQSAVAAGAGQLRDTLKLRPVGTPGLLVFTESYNADWQLRGQPDAHHIVALGFANGYDLRRPLRPGSSLTYRLAPIGRDATYASALAWGLLGIGLLPFGRLRRRR